MTTNDRGSGDPIASDLTTGIAVIGCGYWGVNYVRIFEELEDARVVAVCDQRLDALEKVGRRVPNAALTTDIEAVLGMHNVDAVVVATGPHTHADLVRRALSAGRDVLVEKPLTTSSVDAAELSALATDTGRVLLVGHTFLYNAAVRKVKEYVQRDDVHYIYSRRTNLGPIREDVNAVWDLATHDISIFNYLLESQPVTASAVGARVLRNTREDVAFISLAYPGGVVGHVHASWADPHKVRELVVVSSERRVVFNDVDPVERVRVYEKGVKPLVSEGDGEYASHQLAVRDGDIISPALPISEPLRDQCSHFLDCVRTRRQPFTDARQGHAVVRVLEAIDQSMAAGGAPVEVASGASGVTPAGAAPSLSEPVTA